MYVWGMETTITYRVKRECLSDGSFVWNVVGKGFKAGCRNEKKAEELAEDLNDTVWIETEGVS